MQDRPIWTAHLLPLEKQLLHKTADISDAPLRTINVSGAAASDPRLTGHFIRWYLLEFLPRSPLSISTIKFNTIVVSGVLDLANKEITVATIFENCVFSEEIRLTDALLPTIEFESCTINTFLADRLSTTGTFRIRRSRALNGSLSSVKFLRLNGASVGGNLDFRGSFFGPSAEASPCIWADGLTVEGNMLLIDGFMSRGEIRINGAKLNRNLDCSGATMLNHRGFSITAAGAAIAGSVYFCKPKEWSDSSIRKAFRSEGRVRLSGATIGGHLDLDEGQFVATAFTDDTPLYEPKLFPKQQAQAITGNGIQIGGDLNLHSSCIRGAAVFISAKIKGDVYIEDSNLDFPGQETLVLASATIEGEAFICNTKTNGVISFAQASLVQGLRIERIFLDRTASPLILDEGYSASEDMDGPACGIHAPKMSIGGTFYWQNGLTSPKDDSRIRAWLYLADAKCASIEDDRHSWRMLDRFAIEGLSYSRFSVSHYSIPERIRDFHRQYDNERFRPQPYVQLARAARDAGDEKAANDVLVQMERVRTWRSGFSLPTIFWRLFLDVTLKYGFAPYRPILILALWTLPSALIFAKAHQEGVIVSAQSATSSNVSAPPIPFSSLLFSTDTLVPIVDFNQKRHWIVVPAHSQQFASANRTDLSWRAAAMAVKDAIPNSAVRWLIIFNTIFGWTMTTLFAASVTGLLRRAKDY